MTGLSIIPINGTAYDVPAGVDMSGAGRAPARGSLPGGVIADGAIVALRRALNGRCLSAEQKAGLLAIVGEFG